MNTVVDQQTRVQVSCAYEELAREVELAIGREGFVLTGTCPLTIVVDKPAGFALRVLLRCPQKGKVVITDNPCSEYWEDLWGLAPQVLLAGGHSTAELVVALRRASRGEHYRQTPKHSSELTPRERDTLRLCAMSYTNEEIAEQLGIKMRTVQNNLNSIFTKLGLKHRGQAILYYWGMWDWLTVWQSSQKRTRGQWIFNSLLAGLKCLSRTLNGPLRFRRLSTPTPLKCSSSTQGKSA